MKTDQNTTVWWHGTESRNYSIESANKVSKCNEARKKPWATVPQCGHKTFLHQNLVWSCLETLMRAGIVSPRTSQHSFHIGNTDCHHPKCCPPLESRCVSWEMPWHVIPLKIVLHVSYVGRKQWDQTSFWHYYLFVVRRVCRFQRSCHIPNIEKTRSSMLKVKTCSVWSKYVIPHSGGSLRTTCSFLINLIWQIHTTLQKQSIGNLQFMIFILFFQWHCHFVSCIIALLSAHRNQRFMHASVSMKNICIP